MIKWKFNNPQFEYQIDYSDPTQLWAGHIYFAYDLISTFKPESIVELGTFKGTSFFSFCQAVKDLKLNTKIYAIDTWEGDVNAGFYNTTSTYEHVKNITRKYYSRINARLLKMTFEKALPNFEDNSIDILHIDGCHEYESVSKDYESYKNKVNKNGIILFHDIQIADYGVWRVFEQAKKENPNAAVLYFKHNCGLGVIFKNFEIDVPAELLMNYYETIADLTIEKLEKSAKLQSTQARLIEKEAILNSKSWKIFKKLFWPYFVLKKRKIKV